MDSAVEPGPALLAYSLDRWKDEPEMRVQDAYKWLFHATLGGEHAISSDEGPRLWMDEEWASLGRPLPGEPLVVRLRPDGAIIRVNLRPYKAAGGSKEALLTAFVDSARQFKGDQVEFHREWLALGKRLKESPFGLMSGGQWSELDAHASAADYPAVHHSPEYERICAPAYRVVLFSEFEKIR